MDQHTNFSQGLQYQINDDGKTCAVMGQGTCTDLDVVIPSEIDGYRVTAIVTKMTNDYCTENCIGDKTDVRHPMSGFSPNIRSVVIPDSVTVIGKGAFAGCTRLENVTVPDSVTVIGVHAFFCCTRLAGITVPDSVRVIEWGAFSGCTALAGIVIPESVTVIGYRAFADCLSLKDIRIDRKSVV